jgi:hypothetical protein
MKKSVALILCLLAVGAAGYYLMLRLTAVPGQYARYLPRDVVGAVSLTQLNSLTDSFRSTALGRFVAKDTVHAIMDELRVQPAAIAEYDRFYNTIAQVMTNPAFRAVFGNDATVALLPPDLQALEKNPIESLRHSLVVVAATSASGALDLFGRLVTSKSISRETIDGLELTRIVLEQDQVMYGYADKQSVLLAYSPAAIKTCVTIRQGEDSLEKTAAFQEAVAFWKPYPEASIYSRAFVNAAALAGLLNASGNPEVAQSGALLQGVDSMVSLTYKTDRGLESRARATYRYDQLHQLVKSAVDSASTPNQSLHLLKEHSLAYNWASSLRPEMLLQALSTQGKNYQEADAVVRENLDISLEQLGKAVGPQYGGVLDDIVKTGLFPAPKMVLFLGIRDRQIAETALTSLRRKIAAYGLASEEQELVDGQTLYSWSVLPGEATQPAVVLTDNMFYLASSKAPLKNILTGTTAAEALSTPVADKLGPELSERVTRANYGSLVVYPQRMSQATGKTIDWLSRILATTKNISISRLNTEVVQLMQSTEVLVLTSSLGKAQGDWTMTLRMAAEQQSPQAGQ